jgi:carbamate kinase
MSAVGETRPWIIPAKTPLSPRPAAEDIDADLLILLTDAPGVFRELGRPDSIITAAQPMDLRLMRLPAGSMGTKAEAACRFVERTGRRAAIGALEDAAALVAGTAGTQVKRL